MKIGLILAVFTICSCVQNLKALDLFLNNVDLNNGLITKNTSQSSIDAAAKLTASVVLIEYAYNYVDDDEGSDKTLAASVDRDIDQQIPRQLEGQRFLRCLGNLITAKFVVTTASCVKYTGDYKPVFVLLADNQNISIATIVAHEKYHANIRENFDTANQNNIALIELENEAKPSEKLSFIKFSGPSDDRPLTINWRLLDDSVLPTNFTSIPGDKERYNFEVMPIHVYGKSAETGDHYLKEIIADGGASTKVSDYEKWISRQLEEYE